ncbi:MAG: uracil-DNA glycosylase [Gammaproteobacteria bacterium]|nr:uracil-DNA glycosylase [Gammaproteobacteria bacterium]
MSNKSAYLKAMGIDVWVERNPIIPDIVNGEAELSAVEEAEPTVVSTSETSIPAPIESNENIEAEVIATTNIETLDWQPLRTHISECQLCGLSKTRTQTIFGSGNQTASLMIIGDVPNADDEQQGEPFSGQAGKLLTAMLKAMGYQRSDVYISNIVKCKTTENQEPAEDEAISCEPYLLRQIKLLQPKLILALGNAAAQRLLKSKSTMSRLRGQLHYVDGINAPILVSYHPTYLLAAPNEKRKAWEDLQLAMKELKV